MLASRTDPRWVSVALARFDEVLCDHAHCEKKAAAQAMSLLATYPDRVRLVQAMSRLAQEELGHFRQVFDRVVARGLTLPRDHGDPYARALRKLVRHREDDTRLTDLLLVSGFIEARSHERLELLADALVDEDLKRFYTTLAQAEAGHCKLFVGLAEEYADPERVAARVTVMAAAEAEILAGLPVEPRIH